MNFGMTQIFLDCEFECFKMKLLRKFYSDLKKYRKDLD